MTRLLISTAFAGLLALGGASSAQDRDGQRDRGRNQQAAPPAAQPAPRTGGQFGRGYNPPAAQNAPRAVPPSSRNAGPDNDRRGPGPGNGMRGPDNDRRAFGNDRRGPDQRRDFSSFHRNFNAPRRFRAQIYQRPRGWYAHRWIYGEILPSLFWAPDFWLNDYFAYGLEPPPPGTVWVRDGDDALLIDRFSGEIIQVAYDVFY